MLKLSQTCALPALLAGTLLLPMLAPAPAMAQDAAAKIDKPEKKERPPLYDEQADARDQIATALAAAKKENRRVLIQWGANWCTWCYAMEDTFTKDRDVRRKLMYEYDVLHINVSGDMGDKNRLVAAELDAVVSSLPYLTILDSDGEVLVNQTTEQFEMDGKDVKAGHDPAKMLAFFEEHQADYLSADSILADAQSQAKAEGKRVFVHYGAPWCGWCKKMEKWLAQDDVAEVFGRHFIDLKIDIDRTIGGADLLHGMAQSKRTGIPWSAILDTNGEVAAPSYMGEMQNIGHPQSDDEIDAFAAMLAKGSPDMPDEDIEFLAESLRDFRPAKK